MTRLAGVLALLLLPASTLLFSDGPAVASPAAALSTSATGTVTGHVFHDINGDGVYDEGELGLRRLVQLVQDHTIVAEELSLSDGSYSMTDIPPGEYELATELDGAVGFCVDPAFPNFDPLLVAGCPGIVPQPWHPTTPERYAVTVSGADTIRGDFGATPFDQGVLLGRAILNGEYAPPGTAIDALINGQMCGTTTVPTGPFPGGTYRIIILGAGEQGGCPLDGQDITLRIGGVHALEPPAYIPEIRQTGPSSFIHNPVAMPNHAWYWVQQVAAALPPAGTRVQALVDGTVCGETELQSDHGASGFSRLVVPSESVNPGCAYPGATVKFRFDGVEASTSVVWIPGVRRLTLELTEQELSPTPTLSPAPTVAATPFPAALPQAGGEPQRVRGGDVWLAIGALMAIITMGLLCFHALKSTRVR